MHAGGVALVQRRSRASGDGDREQYRDAHSRSGQEVDASMDDRSQTRREMHQVLNGDGERPAPSLGITRRTFLHRSLLAGAGLGIGTHGWFPLINTVDLAFGASEFKFAWISDTHLYPKSVNTRFVDTAVRAVKEVQAMSPPAEFLIVGCDIGQLGDPVELELGAARLNVVTIKKAYMP